MKIYFVFKMFEDKKRWLKLLIYEFKKICINKTKEKKSELRKRERFLFVFIHWFI